jgi:hypothetical protein
MNTRILVAFLAATSLSGCFFSTGGGGGGGGTPLADPGDVTFQWTFDGGACADVPDVQMINISIVGETLVDNGFPCLVGGYPGIVLHGFAGRSYSFTIEALGYGGERLFVASGIFAVDGDVTVNVDLQPVAGPHSYAFIGWNLPPNAANPRPDCAEAGVSEVEVRIDNGFPVTYPCTDGNPAMVLTNGLISGPHAIALRVLGSDGTVYFGTEGTFSTWVGYTDEFVYTMSWAVGAPVGVVSVKTQLWAGTTPTPVTCAWAGVSTLYVDFQDSISGIWFLDPVGQPCSPQGVYYGRFVPAGTYDVIVTDGATPTPYYTSPPYIVTVANRAYTYVTANLE